MIKEIDQLREKVVKMATEQLQLKQELERQKNTYENRMKAFFLSVIEQLDGLQAAQAGEIVKAEDDEAQLALVNELYDKIQTPLQNILTTHHIYRLQAPADQLPEYSTVVNTVRDKNKINGTLVRVQQSGYLWGDQLLRPTGLVVVKND